MSFISIMLRLRSILRMSFFLVSLTFLIVTANGAEQVEQNLQPSAEAIPELSPGPTFEESPEPSLEPELPPMAMSALVDESYMRHVDFIRQGMPMPLVQSFYNHALKEAASPGCIPADDNVVLGRCTTPLYDENDEYALKSLLHFITEEEGRRVSEKYFPDLIPRADLPFLTDEENTKISAAKSETLQRLNLGDTNEWNVSVFPADEEIRFDPGNSTACTELEEKMPYNGLTMTASSLTAFVLGMTAQIIALNEDSPQARMILENHMKLMYIGARCNRVSGDKFEVPTQQLRELIRRSKLALIARSVDAAEASLPPFEFMKEIIDGSKHFFGEEIERMSSMNSFGRINYITWTGDSVSSERLDSRIATKTTLQTLKNYYEDLVASSPEPNLECQSGFSYLKRLETSEVEGESCCAETCIIYSGRKLDLSIVNEMCCIACSEENCDLSKLARVIQVEAFRFSRSAGQ